MLRNLTELGRKVYTCTCLLKNVQVAPRALFHTTRAFQSTQNDPAQTTDNVDDDGADHEKGLKGINLSGILVPTQETLNCTVDGVAFSNLPICFIKSSKNNTLMSLTNHTGQTKILSASCGTEGFQNAKQKTAVAAQATGLALGYRAVKKGVKNMRVVVKGLGQGRLASIKGLQAAGVNVVSITDNTLWANHTYRPRRPPSK